MISQILYKNTNYFSKLIIDYLDQDKRLSPYINYFPNIKNVAKQILEKKEHQIDRNVLVEVLKDQNSCFKLTGKSKENIELLSLDNTFSVTTGHQLCLFTGPLYFIYKILSTINLSEQLNLKYPENNFVPVFWMASEDHDLNEINSINLFKKKIQWNTQQSGAVGRMNLDGLKELLVELKLLLGSHKNAAALMSILEDSYLNHDNLADATRFLVNKLFGDYGLVIIDGDNKKLKKQFIPQMKKDILESSFFSHIQNCSDNLKKDYHIQANARKINFFKLLKGKRVLIKERVLERSIIDNPENFSPNVLLRPLYQEIILPNIAYIGGQAEIAYWMQLKDLFSINRVPFPLLFLRNSALLINQKKQKKFERLGFRLKDLFFSNDQLNKKYLIKNYKSNISLENDKKRLTLLFQDIESRTNDVGLKRSINAQLQKQLNSLNNLQEKFIRVEKKNHEFAINQIDKIKKQFFPDGILQERYDNIISFYLIYGENFIKIIKDSFKLENHNFVILTLED